MSKGKFVNLNALDHIADAINIFEINGSAPGITSQTSGIRYCAWDMAFPGVHYPLKIPIDETITHRSYFKTVFLEVVDWGELCKIIGQEIGHKVNKIGRLSTFCDKSVFGPCNLFADEWNLSKSGKGGIIVGQRDDGEHGMPVECYVQATGIQGVTGYPLEDHPYYKSQNAPTRKLDCFTIDRPCLIDRSIHKSEFRSKAVVTQAVVPATAAYGEKPGITIMHGVEVWG